MPNITINTNPIVPFAGRGCGGNLTFPREKVGFPPRKEKKNMKKSTATLFLLAASTIWGISFVVMKGLLDYIPINRLLAMRFTVAAIGLSYVLFKYKDTFKSPKAWLRGFLVGLCMVIAFIFQTYGLLFIGGGKNALITAVYVVLVPFIMWAIKKKKPTFREVVAGFVCFGGIAVLSLGNITQSNANGDAIRALLGYVPATSTCEIIGLVLTLISGALYALHIAIVNVFGEDMEIMPLSFMQYLFAAIIAWGVSLVFESSPAVTAAFPKLAECFPEIWLSLAYVCFLSTLVAFTFQNIGVKNAPPAFASIILCLESLFGCIISIIFTSEQLTWNIAVGAVIIIASVLVSELKLQKKKI